MSAEFEGMAWEVDVPIFRNAVILRQLGIAIGIPFGLLVLVIILTAGRSVYALYALGLIGALLLMTALFLLAVYRGKYKAEFMLNSQGARCRTQARQARTNGILNGLTVVLGLLMGKPAVAGAGMLAQSRQDVLLRWNKVRKVTYIPRSRTIWLRGGFAEHVALFCTPENYDVAALFIREKTRHLHGNAER